MSNFQGRIQEFAMSRDLSEETVRQRLIATGLTPRLRQALARFHARLEPGALDAFALDYLTTMLARPELADRRVPSMTPERLGPLLAANLRQLLDGPIDVDYVLQLVHNGMVNRRLGIPPTMAQGVRPGWVRWALSRLAALPPEEVPLTAQALVAAGQFDQGWIQEGWLFEDGRIQRVARAHMEHTFMLVPTGIVHTDGQRRVVRANPALCALMGEPEATLRGKVVSTILPLEALLGDVQRSGEAVSHRRVEWRDRPLQVSAAPVDGDDGCLVITIEDLTPILRSERKTRTMEQRLHAVVGQLDDGMMLLDHEGGIDLINRAAERILGAEEGGHVGHSLFELLPPSLHEAHRRGLARIATSPSDSVQLETLQVQLERPDGQRVHVDIQRGIHRVDGQPVYSVRLRDVTAEHEAAERLRQSEQEQRTIIESLPDVVAIHQGGRFVYVNSAMVRMFGLSSAADLVGQPIRSIVHPDYLPTLAERMAEMARTQKPLPPLEERFVHSDGSALYADVVALPIRFQGAPATLTIGHETTERKALTARMMQMDRMVAVGTLAAGVGHEINNPLTFVVGNVDSAREGLAALEADLVALRSSSESPDQAQLERMTGDIREIDEMLDDVGVGGRRIRDIVRDMRAFTRSESSVHGPVRVDRALAFAVSVARNEIRHRGRLVQDLQPVPPALGDESQLGQVLLNLLINAAHALDGSGTGDQRVSVRSCTLGEQVCVEVSDTGAGIAPEHMDRIFEPFFSTKPVGVGTGLGLSICRRLVNEHGGHIEVESQLGEGTTFRVLLPIARDTSSAAPDAPALEPSPARRARVLVVDDEASIVRLASRILSSHHDIDTARSFKQAQEVLAEAGPFDVILCDVMMPGGSGVELFEAVRSRDPEQAARFVFVTGGAFTPGTEDFVENMAQPCIHKPFTPKGLREAVAKAMDGTLFA